MVDNYSSLNEPHAHPEGLINAMNLNSLKLSGINFDKAGSSQLTASQTMEQDEQDSIKVGSRFESSGKVMRKVNMADVMKMNRVYPINIQKYASSKSPIDTTRFAKKQSAILLQQSVPWVVGKKDGRNSKG